MPVLKAAWVCDRRPSGSSGGLLAASAVSAALVGRVAPNSILQFGVCGGLVENFLFVALLFSNGMVLALAAIPNARSTASAILGADSGAGTVSGSRFDKRG